MTSPIITGATADSVSMATKLLELAERCEQATGSDRELDAEIYVALDPELENLDALAINGEVGTWVPDFTASLDAAMMLVPEGMQWFKERGAYVPNIAVIQGPICSFVGETDSTFALALCAAALRARAAQ